jgi:hypothetical protein
MNKMKEIFITSMEMMKKWNLMKTLNHYLKMNKMKEIFITSMEMMKKWISMNLNRNNHLNIFHPVKKIFQRIK